MTQARFAAQLFTIPTIQFGTEGVFSTPQTINLSGGQGALPIQRSMTINGGNRVTVDAQNASRVFDVHGSTMTINESTLSGNNAGRGGGIMNFAGTANIQRATIFGNQSGIFSEGSAATTFTNVQGSIVSNNTEGDVVRDGAFFNTIVSQGFNIVGNGTAISAFGQTGDQVGVNPLLIAQPTFADHHSLMRSFGRRGSLRMTGEARGPDIWESFTTRRSSFALQNTNQQWQSGCQDNR